MSPNALVKSSGSLSRSADVMIENIINQYPDTNTRSLAVFITNELKKNRVKVKCVPTDRHMDVHYKGSVYSYPLIKK
jgi:hypothetical protein